ncbi:MAG: hypothetical protein KTR26_14600 [Flammeovirgaceae bacterium]|nr:hypothetical protein [Flammeovirgaceae bacterium]
METEFKIKIRLRNIAALINLKTQPLFTFPEYQALQKSVYQDENVEIIDSVYVILKSGLSWEINEGSPPKPKRFLFKFASKKRREEKPVKDYLDYLEFCSWCENHGIPNCIIEKFQRKSLIYINNKKSYQLKFYIKYNPDMGLVITDKSIKKY